MNRIYKVIFNHALQVFQVVSELANGHPKSETPVGLKGRSFACSADGKSRRIIMALLAAMSLPVYSVLADNTITAGNNITVDEENNQITISTVDNPVFEKVTSGGSSNIAVIDNSGISVNDKIYITGNGLNANGQKIIGVAAGIEGTDAVNLNQLNAVSANISWTAQVNGQTVKVVTPTDKTLNFTDGQNISVKNVNGAIQISTSSTPSFSSVTAGTGTNQVILGDSGVQVGGAVYISGAGINSNGKTITGVAAGENDTDAVNKLQMNTAINNSMKYFKANSTGTDATASGDDAVAVGSGAVSAGNQSVSMGLQTSAEGENSLAVGNAAAARKNSSVAVGNKSSANGEKGIAIGDSSDVKGDNGLAVGASSSAAGSNGTALGYLASAGGSGAAAVGNAASASGNSAAAFGDSASASGSGSIALGVSSQASGLNDISLGAAAGVGTQAGSTSKIQQNRISIGANAGQNGTGNENTAIGLNAGDNVTGNFNVAMGSSAGGSTNGDANTAIGFEANKSGSGSHSTAIGASMTAASGAAALGYTAAATKDNSVAVGYAAQALGSSGIAIGDSSVAKDNSIALGHNSIASAADSSGSSYLTGLAAGTNGVVSVGSSEGNTIFQRRIINVADGSNGTDAVNVNQLKTAQTSVATLIGGGVTLNTDGSYGQFSLTDKEGTIHHYDTLAEALGAVTSDQIQVATENAVTYTDSNKTNINANGTISKVIDATSSDQAVNLGQMTTAIADSQTKYYSVNSSESGNRDNTGATGEDAIAAGPAATAVGDRSISIGDNTKAQGTNSIAIGNSNTTSDRQATAYGQSSIAIGSSASSNGTNSIALGNYALTEVQNSTTSTVNSAIAIGDYAQATSDQAVAIGKNAHASGTNAFAQGNTSSATAESSIAVGTNANASGTASTVIGMGSAVSGTHSGLIGTSMSTDTNQTGQTLTGSDTYVVGNGNGTVGGTNSSIIGNSNTVGTTVTDPNGITHSYNTVNTSILGNSNTVTAQDADVIGHGNTVGKKNLNAAGIADGTIDTAAGSGVFGGNNTVYGSGNRIIGNNNTDSNLDGVFILGNNVTAGLADSVYLGSNSAYVTGSDASSTTAGVNSYSSVTIGSGNYTFAGANAAGVVTVGSVGSERRIQNVSAGLVSSTSTDAVNGSQLYTLTQPLRFAGDNSTVGSSSALDKNVIQRSSDQALKITGGANLNNLSSNNIGVVASTDTNTLTVQLAKDLTGLNSVTTGNTVMNTNGVTIGSGSSAVSLTNDGLSNGNNTITNVKAGVNGTDAVNVSQLNTAAAKATTTVSNGTNTTVSSTTATDGHTNYQVNLNDKITLGSGANAVTVDGTAGAVTAGTKVSLDGVNGRGTVGNVTINGSGTTGTVNGLTNKTWDPNNYVSGQAATEDQLKLAVNTSNTTVTNAGLNFAGNDGSVIHKNLGEQLNIVGGYEGTGTTSSKNVKTVKNASGDLEIQMADDAVFNSITTGSTVLNTNGVTIGSGSSTVSLTNTGLNNGGNKITNVAAGTDNTDAVNVSQLNTAAAKATTTVSNGTNTTVSSTTATDGHTNYQVNLNDKITLGSGANAVTVDGTAGAVTAGTKVSLDGVNGRGTVGNVTINGSGTTGTVNGLTNKTWDPNNYVSGQAATEDQLKLAVNTSNTTVTNAGLNFAGNDGSVIHKNLGEQLNIVGGYEGTGTTSSKNVKTVKNASGDLEIQMADDAVFNSITTGSTVLNTNGVTIGSGSSTVSLTNTGLNNGGNKITNVAAGTDNTDAVNVSQLNKAAAGSKTTVSDGVNTTVSSATAADGHTDYQVNLNKDITVDSVTAGNTKIDTNGLTTKDQNGNTTSVTGNGMTVTGSNGKTVSVTSEGLDNGGNTITNVAAGVNGTDAVNVDQLNDTVEKAAAAAKTTVSAGKNMTVTPDTTAADGHTDYKVALNDTVTLGEGANAVTINGTNGTVTAGTKVSLDGVNGTGTVGNVTINGSGSTGTVNGLTNKTWDPKSYTSGQAATEDQLKELDDRSVQYDRNEDGSVNKGQITLGGDSGTKITNVAAGELSAASTDAVNGSQLYATNQAVENNTNNINILGDSVNRLGDRVNKVGAGAAALAALHPLDFDPDDKWDAAAGFGNYRNANAGAVGIFYRPNEDTMVSVGGSFGNGENMINAGVSFKLGQGNHVSTSRVAMAKELKDMRAVVAQQAEQIAKLTELVNAMAGVKREEGIGAGMFPDVPENHWAYEAVKSLGEKGLIEGYPDGSFGGERSLSRYEFAEIVYRALERGVKVEGRLVSEFKPELERIRVDTVSRDRNGRPVIERVRVVR